MPAVWRLRARDLSTRGFPRLVGQLHTVSSGGGGEGAPQSLMCCCCSVAQLSLTATPWTAASLSFTISWSLLRLISIGSVMPSNHLILYRPLLRLPSTFPIIRVFSNELALCIKCPKYRSFSFSINPFNEYSRLISFRVDWLDLFAVRGTLKSLLQHHSSSLIYLSSGSLVISISLPSL